MVTITPDDTLLTAHGAFKLYGVSQLPVVETASGSSESWTNPTSCWLWLATPSAFGAPVAGVMSTRLDTVPPDAPIERLLEIFEREHVPIMVGDGGSSA